MKFRDFGTTGKKVTQLVSGGGALVGLLINQDDETKLKAVRRAIGAGINWIDSTQLRARALGSGIELDSERDR